jgi:hypothetical protein
LGKGSHGPPPSAVRCVSNGAGPNPINFIVYVIVNTIEHSELRRLHRAWMAAARSGRVAAEAEAAVAHCRYAFAAIEAHFAHKALPEASKYFDSDHEW